MNEPANRRPPPDAFDLWLRAVVHLIIEPILDVIRAAGLMIRRHLRDRQRPKTWRPGGSPRHSSGDHRP